VIPRGNSDEGRAGVVVLDCSSSFFARSVQGHSVLSRSEAQRTRPLTPRSGKCGLSLESSCRAHHQLYCTRGQGSAPTKHPKRRPNFSISRKHRVYLEPTPPRANRWPSKPGPPGGQHLPCQLLEVPFDLVSSPSYRSSVYIFLAWCRRFPKPGTPRWPPLSTLPKGPQ
jgi:hypothetical protein